MWADKWGTYMGRHMGRNVGVHVAIDVARKGSTANRWKDSYSFSGKHTAAGVGAHARSKHAPLPHLSVHGRRQKRRTIPPKTMAAVYPSVYF